MIVLMTYNPLNKSSFGEKKAKKDHTPQVWDVCTQRPPSLCFGAVLNVFEQVHFVPLDMTCPHINTTQIDMLTGPFWL